MDLDAIVIGSGAGGGAAARVLADGGRRVLLLERGGRPSLGDAQSERRMILEKAACDDRPLKLNGREERLFTGGVVGGSTTLYGAALLRPSPEDFVPGRYYAEHLPRELWEWPVGYDELDPYLEWAEDLFHVAGNHCAPVPHLGRRRCAYKGSLPPLEPVNVRLAGSMHAEGLSPFRLPLAIDFETCLRCPRCPGYACPNGSRASSWKNCIRPALQRGGLELWEQCEALGFRVEHGRVEALRVRRRQTGEVLELRAERYLVAAGAVGTPALLERSGLGGASGQLGRNHMCHLGAVAAAVFPRPIGAADRFLKQLGLTDYYLGAPEFPHKLGYAQFVPIPGPRSIQAKLPLPLPRPLARALHRRSLLFAGAVEDLPHPGNRVRLEADGTLRLDRRFGAYDVARGRWLARRLRQVLRRAGATLAPVHIARNEHAHAAHQVGTCRFGRDPRHAVLDPDCRLHGHERVYVVDGSFMPTSLGVGPALTIFANALRVASRILEERA